MNNVDIINNLCVVENLVKNGVLPITILPRLFYFGHKNTYSTRLKQRQLQCINCNVTWDVEDIQFFVCPICQTHEYIYDITDDSSCVGWQCLFCKHEWTSKDGHTCHKCGITVDNNGKPVAGEK